MAVCVCAWATVAAIGQVQDQILSATFGISTQADLARATEKIGEMAAEAEQAMARNPRDPDPYLKRGYVRLLRGLVSEATSDFDRAIELDPNSSQGFSGRAFARQLRQEWKTAIEDWTRSLEIAPRQPGAYFHRGAAHNSLGQREAAVADWDRVIEMDPKYALAYHNRGTVREATGNPEGALADYSKAIELNPSFGPGYAARGNLRKVRGDRFLAMEDLDQAIKLQSAATASGAPSHSVPPPPGPANVASAFTGSSSLLTPDPGGHVAAGRAKYESGDLEGALAAFNQAIDLNPANADAFSARSAVQGAKGNFDAALSSIPRSPPAATPSRSAA